MFKVLVLGFAAWFAFGAGTQDDFGRRIAADAERHRNEIVKG